LIGTLPLARIFVRYRLRSVRNAYRARGRGRTTVFAMVIGVITAFAYVGLFTQAFSVIVHTVDLAGQLAALALVTGTIAFGSLTARAASNEAVRAGSPENEFLLARPVALPTLVAARGLADAVTDPVGGLFLLPVLISVTFVWRLSLAAVPIAIAISLLTQIAISMLAYAVQLAVVRYVPGGRRRMVWTGLRLVAAFSLASMWMLGTWVMRAPAALGVKVSALAPALAYAPSALVSAPLAALARGAPGGVALALGLLVLIVLGAVALTVAVARRAGMAGWEEAGAVWADAAQGPGAAVRRPTAATKDLRLITRDRSQLLALVALPVIFIGVQIFGAAGWSWTTASLARISCFVYSLALYMGTIGPLTHMQAERRAFWILRTVPVPLGRLLAAKARAWAIIIGGIAVLAFTALSVSVPGVTAGARLGAGLLVTVGAAGISFIAVAMASGGADLSDETNTAVGPGTVYAYLFVGGLFNLVLVEGAANAAAGLALYAFAGWTYWHAGVEQAGFCLDAEALRTRRVRAADGATMLILYALGARAAGKMGDALGSRGAEIERNFRLGLLLAIAAWAVFYLWRRPRAVPRARTARSLLLAASVGALAGGVVVLAGRAGDSGVIRALGLGPIVAVAALIGGSLPLLCQEILLRGLIQRSLPASRWWAALISAGVGLVIARLSAFAPGARLALAPMIAIAVEQAAAAVAYALTGRVAAAWLARVVLVGVGAFV